MSSSDEEYKTLKQVHHGATGKPLKNRAIEKARASKEQAEGRKIVRKAEEDDEAEGGIVAGGGITKSPFDTRALRQQSYSTDAQAVETKVARNPATQYLVLNSKDRNQTSSTGQYVRQAWNQFRLQRPQNIMQTYATRMLVSEINFPYYIPNINPLNNKIWLRSGGVLYEISIATAFRTGTLLATIITDLIATGFFVGGNIFPSAVVGNTITLTFNTATNVFTWTGAEPYQLYWTDPNGFNTLPPSSEGDYYSNTSLSMLIGMEYPLVNGSVVSLAPGLGGTLNSNPTTMQYTQYIDVVSDKLHQYTTNRDGSTDNFFGRNLICRLYISDETSDVIQGLEPFVIHRQFKNAKSVMWNKESAVDWLDIALYDEYGNLLPLPNNVSTPTGVFLGAYPNFQITLLASEN